ncbi:MAG: hypothetical protein JWQ07_2662 [Ramlibacter sp.]|nr:hypothetical protein [Ramlibacter sp.]
MVSCLSLINHAHALAQRQGDFNQTLCGLVVAVADTQPGLIVQDPGAVTCARCQTMLRADAASASAGAAHADSGPVL